MLLPMVKPDGTKIEVGWLYANGKYYSKANLFSAIVKDRQVKLTICNDQPDGTKEGASVAYTPQLFLDGVEIKPKFANPEWLEVDPTNENYHQNVLEWDFGICKRRLRIIEGRVRGRWVFFEDPRGEVRIKYNQSGDFRLKLGQFKINDDEELIPADVFENPKNYFLKYPIEIGDTLTVYPDANPETSTVDGRTQHYIAAGAAWATIQTGGGTEAFDADTESRPIILIAADDENDKWTQIIRSIFLFDTSALPANAVISSATLSLYGTADTLDLEGWLPNGTVYSSNPASNTALVAGDHDSLGSTAFSDTIAYGDWNTNNYNVFTLNAFGRAAIPLDGIAKFGLRNTNYDVENTAPAWASEKYSAFYGYFSDKGSGYKPKLVVEYTPAVGRSYGYIIG